VRKRRVTTRATPFETMVLGPFRREKVDVQWDPKPRHIADNVARIIAGEWARRSDLAAARGQSLFPGPLARLNEWHADAGSLSLSFGPTDYRELVGTNLSHPELGDDFLSNGAGCCSMIRASDAKCIFVRRSARVFEYPGRIHLIGGSIEPRHERGETHIDPFAAIVDEIVEELEIESGLIRGVTCLGLGRDGTTRKPEVLFRAESDAPHAVLLARGHWEHAEVFAIDDDPIALSEFISNHWDEFAPIGLACATAYLACRFAEAFQRAWE
jgi:hypothetical protein